MDISRRSFLRGALSVAAASVVSLPAIASVPVLHGDGVHDDTAALNALFRGETVICENEYIACGGGPDERIQLYGGMFRVSDTVFVRSDDANIHRSMFIAAPGLTGPMLEISGNRSTVGGVVMLGNDKCGGISLSKDAHYARVHSCNFQNTRIAIAA